MFWGVLGYPSSLNRSVTQLLVRVTLSGLPDVEMPPLPALLDPVEGVVKASKATEELQEESPINDCASV